MRTAVVGLAGLVGLALGGCAEAPETDPAAQATMIGLTERQILACMGRPAHVARPAEATAIWTYSGAVTTTGSPPWAVGTNFNLLQGAPPCEVRIVTTNARVSAVTYATMDGRALPVGRQCAFPVAACAARAP